MEAFYRLIFKDGNNSFKITDTLFCLKTPNQRHNTVITEVVVKKEKKAVQ